MAIKDRIVLIVIILSFVMAGCKEERKADDSSTIPDIAENEEVAEKLAAFEGRGALTDESKPVPSDEAIDAFVIANDIEIKRVLSEPEVNQPLEISFDSRGRMWVVQYNQYPYPEGVKITGLDNHLRLQFDKVPDAPPKGVRGADKITIFEDSDGDGSYDRSTDAITGLNIATSVLLGRGKIWVLSPPYLLAYPDEDGDGLPNGDPEVCLQGFGLEDTHAVANSLRWGPDGWIYGAQGSTTTANISSEVSKNVAFQGQAIWRYHPAAKIFEVFAEGGGNTFNLEMDSKGRIYSGYNGVGRGPYFKQGAYYGKSWGKHGPLTNPYAFGKLEDMAFEGEKVRFTHSLLRYESGGLPSRYQGNFIALNPLQGNLVLTKVIPSGSSFRTIDEEIIVDTEDRWFRPIDIQAGPEGKVYFTDWYDSRLSHVDPRDTWDKTSGRIYSLESRNIEYENEKFDLSKYTNEELVELLYHNNRWYRQKALQLIGDRSDESMYEDLKRILEDETGQPALEALWAIHLIGKFSDEMIQKALLHSDPYVRMWSVRLVGDERKASKAVGEAIIDLSENEPNVEVRSQLAASAKRLPGEIALPVLRNLLEGYDDSGDPDIPMQIWWALESKVGVSDGEIVKMFRGKEIWNRPVVEDVLLDRLMQRYILEGGMDAYNTARALFELVPEERSGELLLKGLQEGLRGKDFSELPEDLVRAISPFRTSGEGEWAMALRKGDKEALEEALKIVEDSGGNLEERISYIDILGAGEYDSAVPVLLGIIGRPVLKESKAVKIKALSALQRYDKVEIGEKVLGAYPRILREDKELRLAALSLLVSRVEWSKALLDEIQTTMVVHKEDVPIEWVHRMQLLEDKEVNARIYSIWPEVKETTSEEKTKRMQELADIIRNGKGEVLSGAEVYRGLCGTCHKLFDEGGDIGPELTGYDRQNLNYLLVQVVDPSADIREGYVTYKVKTRDGRVLSGFLTSRSENGITLRPYGGEEIPFSMNEIETMEAQGQSLMPEGLLGSLSDQEVRDLFAYIMKN